MVLDTLRGGHLVAASLDYIGRGSLSEGIVLFALDLILNGIIGAFF